MRSRRCRLGFTLMEMLMVVLMMGIAVAVALPSFRPQIHDELRATAQILASDLTYARSLAVTYASSYRVTFDIPNNRYTLTHSGANSALNTLPKSPFPSPHDTSQQSVVDLDELPSIRANVRLAAVLLEASTTAGAATTTLTEFNYSGATASSRATIIWLTAGTEREQRYLPIRVDPITGLATPGDFTSVGPSGSSGAGS